MLLWRRLVVILETGRDSIDLASGDSRDFGRPVKIPDTGRLRDWGRL